MKKLLMMWALSLTVLLAQTSCASFKNWRNGDVAFCSSSAFITTHTLAPKAPVTGDWSETKKLFASNMTKHKQVIMAYDELNECWQHYHPQKKPRD